MGQQKRVYATALTVTPTPFLCQAVVVCWEPEAGELAVLDLYSFAHDAIGTGSAIRAHEPEVVRPTGPCLPQSAATRASAVPEADSVCCAWRRPGRPVADGDGPRVPVRGHAGLRLTAGRYAFPGGRTREEGRQGPAELEAGSRGRQEAAKGGCGGTWH